MSNTTSPWQERFAWFWYNDQEILRDTAQQLEDKVKLYADMGITTLIGFTETHFRWNYIPYFETIHAAEKRIVEACHKFGVKYVEHISVVLLFAPENAADEDYVRNFFRVKNSSVENWPGLMEHLHHDPELDGQSFAGFYQVDGSTGKPARTAYHGYGLCLNNPDYRKIIFQYLEQIYALGVDGIMTDDTQYFGNDRHDRYNACTCPHCRRLFQEQTGHSLPQPQGWDDFYGDYGNPAFVAWKRFKVESTSRFIHDVNRHFQQLGLHLMRPNYISEILCGNPTSYPFEQGADIWDFVFQENCTFDIMRASFPDFALEAVHRFAMGQQNGKPSMSLFYPFNADSLAFSWSLAKLWGQLYLQTSEDSVGIDSLERTYRAFEQAHAPALGNLSKVADLAFLYSPLTRENTAAAQNVYIPRFKSWLEASVFSGYVTDMVFETDPGERFKKYPALVAAHAAMLADSTLDKLRSYVENGGTLILIGDFALQDESGAPRPAARLASLLSPCTDANQAIGHGRIIKLDDSANPYAFLPKIATDRFARATERVAAPENPIPGMRDTAGKALSTVLGRKAVELDSNEDILAGFYQSDAGYSLHLVNISGILAEQGELVAHFDPIPPFSADAPACKEINISLRMDRSVRSVTAFTPESSIETALEFQESGGRLAFQVPRGTFHGYCLIEIR